MRRLALVLAILAMLALPSTVAASAPVQTGPDVVAQTTVEPDATPTTNVTVQLREDRGARWRIEMRYPLETANETEAFRQYGDAFESGDASGALEASTFAYLADASSTVAGREMAVQNVTRTATVANETGVLRLSFTWTAFLSTDGEQLVLRDAFRLPDDRTWLVTLGSTQRLVIETPPGYVINATNAPVVQRSGAVVIDGPRTFDTEEPLTIRYEPTTQVAGYPWELVAGVGVALIVVLAMLVRRRQTAGEPPASEESGPEVPSDVVGDSAGKPDAGTSGASGQAGTEPSTPADAGSALVTSPSADGTQSPSGTPGAESTTDAQTDDEGAEAGASEQQSAEEPDLSLLSDAERVEYLLEQNGGRMRQADIVDETGWSDAKVSQLLSSMTDEDRVEKLRLGRENLISLPEDEE